MKSRTETPTTLRKWILDRIIKKPGISRQQLIEKAEVKPAMVDAVLRELLDDREIQRFRRTHGYGYADTRYFGKQDLPVLANLLSDAYRVIIRQFYEYSEPVTMKKALEDLANKIPRSTCHERIQRLMAGPRPTLARTPCPKHVPLDTRRTGCIRLSRQMQGLISDREFRVSLGIEDGPWEIP